MIITTANKEKRQMGLGVQRYRRRCLKLVSLVIEVWKMVCKKKVFWQHNCYSRGFVDFCFSDRDFKGPFLNSFFSLVKGTIATFLFVWREKTDVFYASDS